jgi:hypothetical protein
MQEKMIPRLSLVFICLLLFNFVYSQKRVTGKVTDFESSQPVAGSTVTVSGSNVSSQTDTLGNFTLVLPVNKNKITVSSVGYASQDLTVTDQNSLSIRLKKTMSSLNEVVVVGYTSQLKKDLTGAVSVVDVGSMKRLPVGTGEEALQGQASGVSIITSGQPAPAAI